MRPICKGVSKARFAFILATLALTGCVSSGYVYDRPQDRYYGTGDGYYSTAQLGYFGQSGYFGQTRYLPRVVYLDHDHNRYDCRHVSHRDREPHSDRDRHDGHAVRPLPHRPPPLSVTPVRPLPRVVPPQVSDPSPKAPVGRNRCAGKMKCGPSGEASEARTTRDAVAQ